MRTSLEQRCIIVAIPWKTDHMLVEFLHWNRLERERIAINTFSGWKFFHIFHQSSVHFNGSLNLIFVRLRTQNRLRAKFQKPRTGILQAHRFLTIHRKPYSESCKRPFQIVTVQEEISRISFPSLQISEKQLIFYFTEPRPCPQNYFVSRNCVRCKENTFLRRKINERFIASIYYGWLLEALWYPL